MLVYCDTNSLPSNARQSDWKSQRERAALEDIFKRGRLLGKVQIFVSHLVWHELMNLKDGTQRANLVAEFKELLPLPKDEKLLGFNTVIDRYSCICSPMISDVQDEKLRDELIRGRLTLRDAEHISQAVSNDCDFFLTRDEKSILKRRRWLEQRFPALKLRLPSELLNEISDGKPREAN